jgi:hypothetical protein
MAEEKRKLVRVACLVPNGLLIRRFKPGPEDGGGALVAVGPGIRLNGPSSLHTGVGSTERKELDPGITEVDAEWMDAFLAQNPADKNQMIADRLVYVMKDDEPGNPTQEA